MREILFRGKRLDNADWVFGCLRCYPGGAVGICCRDLNRMFMVDDDTVGQFIGLFDKNGKEIFEGDIVQVYSEYYESLYGEPSAVEYGEFNCSCCSGVYGWSFGEGNDIRNYSEYEVVGNVHDNPDLLKISQE